MSATEWWALARGTSLERGEAALMFSDLSREDRERIGGRVKVGLRSEDPETRATAFSLAETMLLSHPAFRWGAGEQGRGPGPSDHLSREIAATHLLGFSLEPGEPVPGCHCPTCETLFVGGTMDDAQEAERVVLVLAELPPGDRVEAAKGFAADGELVLPEAETLAALAADVPGARRRSMPLPRTYERWERQVEEARRLPILEVFRRYVGEARKAGREYVVRCPFHEDDRPSLRISADKGLWFCDPCGIGGDGIELVRRLHRTGFGDAVRELVA